MSKLKSSCPSSDNHDSFHEWLRKHRLEMFYDKLLAEGFENVQDFEGMDENRLAELWDRIGSNNMALKNRFMNHIKTICLKPVVTDENIVSNLKQTIIKYQNIIKTYDPSFTGMPYMYIPHVSYTNIGNTPIIHIYIRFRHSQKLPLFSELFCFFLFICRTI